MSYSSPFTAVVGATILASGWNTSGRDNLNAMWVYTAAGDIAYATSATTLAKLAKPSVTSVLSMDNTGIPSWLAVTAVGGIHAKGMADFAPSQTFSGTWTDITSATMTLVLTAQCTVLVFAFVTGYMHDAGRACQIRAVVDGTPDSDAGENFNGGQTINRLETLPYIYIVLGIPAGSRVVKLQSQADSGSNNFIQQGRLAAVAFTE